MLARPADWYPDVSLRAYEADVLLDGGETIELADISFETIRVPGHSPGHVAYYADGALLSGDVLFATGKADVSEGGHQVFAKLFSCGAWHLGCMFQQIKLRLLRRKR